MAAIPTLEQVRAYLGVDPALLPDDQLQRMYDAALVEQATACRDTEDPTDYPEPLAQAFLRRVQRDVAAKAIPLGLVGPEGGDFGPMALPSYDAVIAGHELLYRRLVVG